MPAAGGRDSKGETRVGEGQSRVCQLQVAGTASVRRKWVRASHACASRDSNCKCEMRVGDPGPVTSVPEASHEFARWKEV